MAKARAKKTPTDDPKAAQTKATEPLDPKAVHELFGIHGPYEPPPPPIPTNGYLTFWDCGMSINEMRRRKKELFSWPDWLDGQAFAKQSDSWRWRQINPTPFDLGKPFIPEHATDLPLARELVCYLVLRVLATGERLEIPRLRCRDTLPSGRRVCVGPWRDSGLEIANVSDRWSAPDLGLCSVYTPVVKRKK